MPRFHFKLFCFKSRSLHSTLFQLFSTMKRYNFYFLRHSDILSKVRSDTICSLFPQLNFTAPKSVTFCFQTELLKMKDCMTNSEFFTKSLKQTRFLPITYFDYFLLSFRMLLPSTNVSKASA